MSATGERQHAPVYSAGLPIRVNTALRRSGLPVLELQSTTLRPVSAPLGNPVLFDSRIPANRDTARHVRDLGATAIDTADVIEAFEAAEELLSGEFAGRLRLVADVQSRIQAAGFYWIRIADFPYPYLTARTAQPATARVTYSASTPVNVEEAGEPDVDDLCWTFTPDELQRWNLFRDAVALRCRSNDRRIVLEAEFPPGRFCPAVEVRRGQHVARLPLKAGTTRIAAGSLVFQTSEHASFADVGSGEFADVETATSITCIDAAHR